jgi:adenosylcobinamide amidohydrolase
MIRRRNVIALILTAITLAVLWHVPMVPRIEVTAPAGLLVKATAVRADYGSFTIAVTVGNTLATETAGRILCTARDDWGLVVGRGTGTFGPLAPHAGAVADVVVDGTNGHSADYVDCALTP